MLRDVMGHLDLATYPQVGMVLFVAVFLVVSAWALTRGSKECDDCARIPLEDEPVEPRPVRGRKSREVS